MIDDRPQALTLRYTNWRGDTAMRRIVPLRVFWGSTEHHPKPCWLLDVHDIDRDARRLYALASCDFSRRGDSLK
jgi:hypothetical protein